MKKTRLFAILLIGVLFLMAGCSKKAESVVIYSCMEDNRNQELKKMLKEKFTDIDVEVQAISTGNSAAKIKNEGTDIEADIILDLETSHAENLKDNFADLSSFDDSIYLDGVNKSDKYLTWVKYTMNLIVDKDYMKKHKLAYPETYEDLLKKEYKNLIAMPDPKTSGTGYAYFLNAVNVMGEDEAVAYFKKLKKNLREFTSSGSGPTNLLKQGEIAIAMGMTSQGSEGINEGYNFKIVELKTGSPYNTTSVAIIKGREKRDEVMEVFEWLINDFGVYDKENYMPDKVLKDQKVNVKNYPLDLKDANMKGVDSISTKEKLMERWSEVNG